MRTGNVRGRRVQQLLRRLSVHGQDFDVAHGGPLDSNFMRNRTNAEIGDAVEISIAVGFDIHRRHVSSLRFVFGWIEKGRHRLEIQSVPHRCVLQDFLYYQLRNGMDLRGCVFVGRLNSGQC